MTQAVDSQSGTITRSYDGLDRLTSEATPQGEVGYTYDAAGRRASLTVPGQAVVNYTFDNADRLTRITQGTSTVSFGYDSANRRTTLTLPNGIVMSYSYDNGSQLAGLTYQLGATTLGNLTYAYDLAGRRTSMGGSYARTLLPSAVSTTSYNAANQLTQWGTATLTYDANGNLLTDSSNGYTWDARNRLVSTLSGASFQYDPFGRRISKTVGGTATNYLYDGVNVAQELVGAVPAANLLTGGVDEIFTRTDSAGARHILTDALGSTLGLTDPIGAFQTTYTYEPFGNTATFGSGSGNPYQYTGRENDGTGLYFYRARYYNPSLQRFIAEDPLGFKSGDTNLHKYVRNNPIQFTDPFGLYTGQIGISINGAIGGITISVSTSIAIDTQGHVAIVNTHGLGGGLGAGVSGGVSLAVSNAKTVCGLGGPFLNVSGTGGVSGLAGTGDFFTGSDGQGRTVDGGGVTLGLGGGASASVLVTDTKVSPLGGRYSCK